MNVNLIVDQIIDELDNRSMFNGIDDKTIVEIERSIQDILNSHINKQ